MSNGRPRRQGMSRKDHHNGPSLLKTLPPEYMRSVSFQKNSISTHSSVDKTADAGSRTKIEDEEDIHRLPESESESDGEEEVTAVPDELGIESQTSHDQEEKSTGVQRLPTTSNGAKYGSSSRSSQRKSSRFKGSSASISRSGYSSQQSDLTDEFGNMTSKRAHAGYGSKTSSKRARTSNKVPENPVTPEKTFKFPRVGVTDSPVDRATFRMPQLLSDDDTSPDVKSKLRKRAMPLSSPLKETESPAFKVPSQIADSFGADFSPSLSPPELDSSEDPNSSASLQLPASVRNLMDDISQEKTNENSPVEGLKCDDNLSDDDLLSPTNPHARCPMCNDIVDREFLTKYHMGRMNVRKQAKFCRAHKKRSGEKEWKARGYPVIDWAGMDDRIEAHHKFLEDLLGGHSSYYKEILGEAVKSGKHRNLKQTMMASGDTLAPGYYGPKGQRIMSDCILKKFSPILRKIAVTDRLVSARGVMGYVQSVLVPELAVLLIKNDMDVDSERARDIMRESTALGDLVNEEAEDVFVQEIEN